MKDNEIKEICPIRCFSARPEIRPRLQTSRIASLARHSLLRAGLTHAGPSNIQPNSLAEPQLYSSSWTSTPPMAKCCSTLSGQFFHSTWIGAHTAQVVNVLGVATTAVWSGLEVDKPIVRACCCTIHYSLVNGLAKPQSPGPPHGDHV